MLDWLGHLMWVQLLEITLLFVVVMPLATLLGTKRPHLAMFLWILFFAKCMFPPVVQSPIGLFAWYFLSVNDINFGTYLFSLDEAPL